jgi:hypothetical protein
LKPPSLVGFARICTNHGSVLSLRKKNQLQSRNQHYR